MTHDASFTLVDSLILYFSTFFDSSIVMSHDIKNVLVHSYLQLATCCSVFPWGVDPGPASRFREVSAALLCPNDLCCLSFPVQNIVHCILDADASVTHFEFPYYLIRLHEFLTALPRYIYFLRDYSYFLLREYSNLRYRKLYQLITLMLCIPQQILNDCCYLVFMILHDETFRLVILGRVLTFISLFTNQPLPVMRKYIFNRPAMYTFPRGGGFRYEFQFDALEPHLTGFDVTKENAFVFVDHVDSTGQLLYPVDKGFVHVNIPLKIVVPFLSVKFLLKIAKLHHISIGSHLPKSEIIRSFDANSCASCSLYHSVFAVVDSKSSKAKNRMRALRLNLNKTSSNTDGRTQIFSHKPPLIDEPLDDKSDSTLLVETKAQVLLPLDPMLEPVDYPPPPCDDTLSHKIISDFCAKSEKSLIEETGCGVCGQLVPTAQLTRIKAVKNLLTVLEVPDVTRVQRKKISDPVRGYKGPVLDYSCDSLCDGCRKHLRNGRVPRNALANGLWLGPVPDELATLGFIEKLLVARVRINSCFIRVASSGLRKMTSHVIAFESPVPKIYCRLPPPMEEDRKSVV